MRRAWMMSVVSAVALLTACSSVTDGSGITAPHRPPTPTPTRTTTTPTSTTADVSTPPPAAKPVRTVQVTAEDRTTTYAVSIWAERTDKTCADHAYGTPVINYLKAHACAGLHRMLATTALGDEAVGLGISDIGFKGDAPQVYQTAGQFEALVKKDGTGNVSDLLRAGYRLPAGPDSVPSPDAFSALGQDAGVEIVDAWYLTGSTPDNDPKLVALAQALFLQLG